MQHSGLAGIRLSSDCMSCRVSSAIDVMYIPIIGLGVPRSQTMSPHPDNRSYHLYVTLISYRSRGYITRTGRISRQYIRSRRIYIQTLQTASNWINLRNHHWNDVDSISLALYSTLVKLSYTSLSRCFYSNKFNFSIFPQCR